MEFRNKTAAAIAYSIENKDKTLYYVYVVDSKEEYCFTWILYFIAINKVLLIIKYHYHYNKISEIIK